MTYIPDERYILNSSIAQTDDAVVRRAVNDFVLDTNRGLQGGISYEHIVGHCDSINNTFMEIRQNCIQPYNWMTTAERIDVVSTAADDSSGGAGARKVRLVGLDANWDKITEDYVMNGTTTVIGTKSFIRVLRAFVLEGGTYQRPCGINNGDISFTSATQGEQAFMGATKGKTTGSRWSIPRNFDGYLTRIAVQCPTTRPIDFILKVRNGGNIVTAPFGGSRYIGSYDEVEGRYEENLLSYRKFSAYSDIWAEAKTSAGNSVVNVTFDVVQVTQ